MTLLIPFQEAGDLRPAEIGAKAANLVHLQQAGFCVPRGFCLPATVYRDFVAATGLDRFISMELQRKDFAAMRWEELWDVALRIRNHFVSVPWPEVLLGRLTEELDRGPGHWPAVAVRSSAPGEDSAAGSFAGLHESHIMLAGTEAILAAIRQVWASLWSDGALLYRRELGLDPAISRMAVIVQEMVPGEASGVLFSQSPNDPSRMMIEAVWGLNQALVDGTLTPDCWQLDGRDGSVLEKASVKHEQALLPAGRTAVLTKLTDHRRGRSPLDETLCKALFQTARELEVQLAGPVDVEWTRQDDTLTLLQVRPVTGRLPVTAGDERPWYLSLHRSLDDLEALQKELETDILPGMQADALRMAATDLTRLDNRELARETKQRQHTLQKWLGTYREKCIPMAHGIRLFGQFYNDLCKPDDPYAFLALLRSDALLAVQRNRQLQAMAALLRNDPGLLAQLKQGNPPSADSSLHEMLRDFKDRYSGFDWIAAGDKALFALLVKLAECRQTQTMPSTKPAEEGGLFDALSTEQRHIAERLLAVARASYALRDNDNLYLGRVRAATAAAETELRRRWQAGRTEDLDETLLRDNDANRYFRTPQPATDASPAGSRPRQRARQLIGQPAGPGVSTGPARILTDPQALSAFVAGEVLVCEAIEPNMTFLVPLATAIIERRGGMLIHGAIIAREYGLPCVTGIHRATQDIHNGDTVTVDGHLGIVTIEHRDDEGS
ncbi:MAG: PEP/pyruvate-binding domain-containing protein [Desulfuromonadales bacterium]